MATATTKVKRPPFMEHFTLTPTSSNTCSHGGCDNNAGYISGFYLVEGRRVRVWVCTSHKVGSPNTELPLPESVQYALDAEADYHQHMADFYRLEDRLYGNDRKSIKALAASGHGEPIPGDRVAAWRWGA